MLDIPETFREINTSEGETLIGPSMGVGNYSWKDWKLRWLRSLHINTDTRAIISLGFPKFCNLGEGCDKYNVSENDLLKMGGTDLYATLKIDGSLLIRYVKDGEVCWRTRGSLTVGLDNVYEIEGFVRDNPRLGDPNLYTNESILFEWVTPENKIVLTYPEPKLFLIGGVWYEKNVPWYDASPKLFTICDMLKTKNILDVAITEVYPLNNKVAVEKLIADLKGNTEIEGFVIRFANGQRLTRLKTEHYLTLHALRSHLTTAKLIELWIQWDKPKWKEYADNFEAAYDYECWQWALPAISSMFDGIREAQKSYDYVQKFVEENRHADRRSFALASQERFNGLQLSLCFTLLDHKEVQNNFWMKMILRNSKQVEMSMFKDRN
ncbi:hypothetical protein LCGC14_1824800 [marine sediment metagenome]|uniref:T4 RNA ligase 1-like N-terminal domain-containing protein n=1 Tax=marine sediment metagenome TaxID=412755 RepID=A0A0F9GI09_9ZZZZ